MNTYQKELINEHKELVKRIVLANEAVENKYDDTTVNRIEYANLCIQLRGMEMYEEALRARIINTGIIINGVDYFEHITDKTPVISPVVHCGNPGSDYDNDTKTISYTGSKQDSNDE